MRNVAALSSRRKPLPLATIPFPGADGAPSASSLRRIALVGTFPPRRCGIATYTADVMRSVSGALPNASVLVLAVSKEGIEYDYPDDVALEIVDAAPESFRDAARYLNGLKADILWVQHEYGIFGGEAGCHLLELLENCKVPVITTMHTVVADPTPAVRSVTERLLRASERVVVMTRKAEDLLYENYHFTPIPPIDVIPHGIPDFPRLSTAAFKCKLDLANRFTLLTFGLLSPGKGIEYAIDAMPDIVNADPSAIYVVLGATHPCLIASEGERYREALVERARALGVESHVRFVNQFVDINLLTNYLGATDIYLSPYLNEAQITSGALSYASGSGCPVVSTPYWHARELITERRGILVPFRNGKAIAEAVTGLIAQPERQAEMRRNSYRAGREATWAAVGESYARACADTARREVDVTRPPACEPKRRNGSEFEMLPFPFTPSRDHLRRMLTPLGIWQHARFGEPDALHGFCTDDNARTLILACHLIASKKREIHDPDWMEVAENCLRFLEEAYNARFRRFRNFRGPGGCWLEEFGSPDAHGRALWACGVVAGSPFLPTEMRHRALNLLHQGLGVGVDPRYLRPNAFAAVGTAAALANTLDARSVLPLQAATVALVERLLRKFQATAQGEWIWFEDVLTYDNAKLPHALIAGGATFRNWEAVETGLVALRWLMDMQTAPEGHFRPIGSNGWMRRGDATPARFDQQPLEAFASASACLAAARATGDMSWHDRARQAFRWFLAENDLHAALYEAETGGVYDGLHPDRVHQNQGAESVLSFHIAHAELTAYSASVELVHESSPRAGRVL